MARSLIAALVALWALAVPAAGARAAELVMFHQAGCPWSALWRTEIGPLYPSSVEGQRAPLRLVEYGRPLPRDLAFLAPATATPTFVLVHAGREIDRFEGYPGRTQFWGYMLSMLNKLPKE